MDVLVSLGTNAAYAYSLISILHHHRMRHHMSGAYKVRAAAGGRGLGWGRVCDWADGMAGAGRAAVR